MKKKGSLFILRKNHKSIFSTYSVAYINENETESSSNDTMGASRHHTKHFLWKRQFSIGASLSSCTTFSSFLYAVNPVFSVNTLSLLCASKPKKKMGNSFGFSFLHRREWMMKKRKKNALLFNSWENAIMKFFIKASCAYCEMEGNFTTFRLTF